MFTSVNQTEDNETSADNLIKLSNKKFKHEILEVIQPSYKNDIKYAMEWRSTWHKISSWLGVIAEVLVGISILIAFIAASKIIPDGDGPFYAFVAGSFGSVSRILARFSDSAKKRSQKKTSELNELLSAIGINYKIPDITDNNDDEPQTEPSKLSNTNNPINGSISDTEDVELGLDANTNSPKKTVKVVKNS